MGIARIEASVGAVNGANAVFLTPTPYTAGSLAVMLNGVVLRNTAGDPWVETDPSTGTYTLAPTCVPRTGDKISAFYVDTLDDVAGSVVSLISGAIGSAVSVAGSVSSVQDVAGSPVTVTAVSASIEPVTQVVGSLRSRDNLYGDIECQ